MGIVSTVILANCVISTDFFQRDQKGRFYGVLRIFPISGSKKRSPYRAYFSTGPWYDYQVTDFQYPYSLGCTPRYPGSRHPGFYLYNLKS